MAGVVTAGAALAAFGSQPGIWLGCGVLAILVAKLIVVNLSLDASVLIGTIVGYVAFLSLLRGRPSKIFEGAFWLLLVAWSVSELYPFLPTPWGSTEYNPIRYHASGIDGEPEPGRWCARYSFMQRCFGLHIKTG